MDCNTPSIKLAHYIMHQTNSLRLVTATTIEMGISDIDQSAITTAVIAITEVAILTIEVNVTTTMATDIIIRAIVTTIEIDTATKVIKNI